MTSQLPTAASILRQAQQRHVETHNKALEEMRRHTDEMCAKLRVVANSHLKPTQLPGFDVVQQAATADPSFWEDTVERANAVIMQRASNAEETPDDQAE